MRQRTVEECRASLTQTALFKAGTQISTPVQVSFSALVAGLAAIAGRIC